MVTIFLYFTLVVTVTTTWCYPIKQETDLSYQMHEMGNEVQEFITDELVNSGYLSHIHPTIYELQSSLRLYQAAHNLTVTGLFDEATQKKMHRFGCGDKDLGEMPLIVPGRRQRMKRQTGKAYDFRSIYDQARWWFICDLIWDVKNEHKTVNPAIVRQMFRRALQRWVRAVNNGRRTRILNLRETFDMSENPDIVLSFEEKNHGDGNPFDGKGDVLAHAFLPFISGRFDGQLHLDKDEDWHSDTLEGQLMSYVILHESGHLFGLSHSNNFSAVMYPYIGRRHIGKTLLHDSDIKTIREKYPLRWCDNQKHVPFYPRRIDRIRIQKEQERIRKRTKTRRGRSSKSSDKITQNRQPNKEEYSTENHIDLDENNDNEKETDEINESKTRGNRESQEKEFSENRSTSSTTETTEAPTSSTSTTKSFTETTSA